MLDFIKTYGVFILALYGIFQYWLIVLWQKYFSKGKLKIYETGTIETSYGPLGPVIKLDGTLRALSKNVFVKSMHLLLIREKDKAQHIFSWFAFRPPKIELISNQQISAEIPYSFLVSTDSPYRYSIAFYDADIFKEIRPLFNEYISEWYKVVTQLKELEPMGQQAEPTPNIISLIEAFRKRAIRVDMYTALDRKCYWEPGDYTLTLNVKISKPDRLFSKTFRFSMAEDEAKTLKLNVVTILEEPISDYLKQKNYPYRTGYLAYK